MPVLFTATTTCQNVMDSVARDVRQTLSSTATPDTTVLIDYVNRIHQDILRTSKWYFLFSAPQEFVTQLGVTNYWLGPTGAGPSNAYDTGLNLTDIRTVKSKTVYDRSNFCALNHIDEAPLVSKVSFADDTSRPGRPAVWRQSVDSPLVMNIYPAPDNQNTYAPQPEPLIVGTTPGGALPDRIYFVAATFVDSLGGESTAPQAAKIYVPAGQLLLVQPPMEPLVSGTSGIKYSRWNVYASNAGVTETIFIQSNQLTRQASLISTGSTWTEPVGGLTTVGTHPPSFNGVEPIDGYIIEFRYLKLRAQVTTAGQVLQVPDDYKDIMVAGVNAYAFAYLTRPQEAAAWMGKFKEGLVQIIRDINFIPRGSEYIQPDPTSIGQRLPAVESIDLSVLQP